MVVIIIYSSRMTLRIQDVFVENISEISESEYEIVHLNETPEI